MSPVLRALIIALAVFGGGVMDTEEVLHLHDHLALQASQDTYEPLA